MAKITVTVPATTSNLGAGFDSLGLALSLYNIFEIEEAEGVTITSCDNANIPLDETNLVYRTLKYFYNEVNAPFKGVNIRQINNIPLARGLGSSSTCIVAALLAGNYFCGNSLSQEEIHKMAVKLEGHPDNAMPALLGGFVASAVAENGGVRYTKQDVSGLDFVTFIPSEELLTSEARAALAKQASYADAVFNLSRTGLVVAAFCTKDYDLLKIGCEDKLHQQYRLPLIKGGAEIFELTEKHSAKAVFISGAGSSLIAITDAGDTEFVKNMKEDMQQIKDFPEFRIEVLKPENKGAFIEVN